MFKPADFREFVPEGGTYSGVGRIVFPSPDGEVSGPATVSISATGKATVHLDIQSFSIPPEYHEFLFPFDLV
jgi:hypothetical protein